jgi:ribosomal protein S18 acetylase RimI-like enzyme
LIIEVGGQRAGRYYLNQAADHFHVVELSILPEYQGHGIGHQLMKSVQAEAFRVNLPVRLRVARGNPAIRFYQGLSFKITGAGETHDSLEWVPGNT